MKQPKHSGKRKKFQTEIAAQRTQQTRSNFERALPFLLCIALSLAVLAVYLQTAGFDFVKVDDQACVSGNPFIVQGLTLDSLKWAATTTYQGLWQPFVWISYMLEYEVGGMNPRIFHLTNVMLHIANALLLFLALNFMTGCVWRSAFVAGLFALHPLRVESVAWVTERKDVLSTFFWMAAILSYAFYAKRPSIARYTVVAVAFLFGLMSKAMVVTLPLVLLLLDYWPLERISNHPSQRSKYQPKTLLLKKIPLLVMAGTCSLITYIGQQSAGGIRQAGLGERIGTAVLAAAGYLWKMISPTNLAFYYPYPETLPIGQLILSILILATISGGAAVLARQRYLTVGWLWYLITLLPVSGLVRYGASPVIADRYTYVPLIGISIMIAWGLPNLLSNFKNIKHSVRVVLLAACSLLILAVFALMAWKQTGTWRNSVTLYKQAISAVPNNWFAQQGLASFLLDEAGKLSMAGKTSEALRKTHEAIELLRKSLAVAPGNSDSHNDLGRALMNIGDREGAIKEYREALRINPKHPHARVNLANLLMSQGRLKESITEYKRILKENPADIYARYNLSVGLQKSGDLEAAIVEYEKVIESSPDAQLRYWSLVYMSYIVEQKGDTKRALDLLKQAVEINKTTGVDPGNTAQKLLSERSLRSLDHTPKYPAIV